MLRCHLLFQFLLLPVWLTLDFSLLQATWVCAWGGYTEYYMNILYGGVILDFLSLFPRIIKRSRPRWFRDHVKSLMLKLSWPLFPWISNLHGHWVFLSSAANIGYSLCPQLVLSHISEGGTALSRKNSRMAIRKLLE